MSQDTSYHAPINVDKPPRPDGAWMCSAYGMNSRPAPLRKTRRSSYLLPIALMVVIPLLVALVVWLVRLSLQH